MEIENRDYLPDEKYLEALDLLQQLNRIILFEIIEGGTSIRILVIRNFISRVNKSLESIDVLWKIKSYEDCWVIFRCILDRLIHLFSLNKEDDFDIFEKWSTFKQHKLNKILQSDSKIKHRLHSEFNDHVKDVGNKYKINLKDEPKWKRPDPKSILKDINLDFFYRYAYDYCSSVVHPMANEGEESFLRHIGDNDNKRIMNHISVLNNITLTTALFLRLAIEATNLKWDKTINRFLDEICFGFLKDGSQKYKLLFCEIVKLGPDNILEK